MFVFSATGAESLSLDLKPITKTSPFSHSNIAADT